MLTLSENSIVNYPYTSFVQVPLAREHCHEYWEIIIFLSDNQSHTVNSISTSHSMGDVIFLRPKKDVHLYNFTFNKKETHHRHRDIYVSDKDMKAWCNLISTDLYDNLISPTAPIQMKLPFSTINHLEELLFPWTFNQVQNASIIKNLHFSAVITLLAMLKSTQAPTMPTQWLNAFVDSLSNPENFSSSIDDLIANIPYSHCHICREFKKATGQTVVNFFIAKKINYAAHLLTNTNLRILDVSSTVGYTSPKNFISQFTKTFKMSPSKWRAKTQIDGKK